MAVGGPALVYYVTPSEEEIFKRYNPELQRRSLEGRVQRQEEFDHFVKHLKEYSKSDKHSKSRDQYQVQHAYNKTVWEASARAEEQRRELARQQKRAEQHAMVDEIRKQRQDMEYSITDPAQRAAESVPPAETPKRKGVSPSTSSLS
jgi:DNA polymerase III alpha subunit (gram-positive type)